MQLYPDQITLESDIFNAWNSGAKDVLAVLPTGGGKTILNASIIKKMNVATAVMAHRVELVVQLSHALAQFGIRHDLIAPRSVISTITHNYYDPASAVKVGSVQTLRSRTHLYSEWIRQVLLYCTDEAHHLCKKNQWGGCRELFINARGLGWTATPSRMDGKGLGRHADGYFDTMVQGKTLRALIDTGRLCDYRLIAPPSDINLNNLKVGASGEYTPTTVKEEVKSSHIIGDIVQHYLTFASDKLAFVFADCVENGANIALDFNRAGIRAELLTAKTPTVVRVETLKKFKAREITVIVNVDLFGEGVDVPALEVVIMARPTNSLNLYIQQFGRALRVSSGKTHGIIIDHVNNWQQHNLPDSQREWSLDRREKRAKHDQDPDLIPLRDCSGCYQPYEAYRTRCPHCNLKPAPTPRGGPQLVAGNLLEFSDAVLKKLRGEIERVEMSDDQLKVKMLSAGASLLVANSAAKLHRERTTSLDQLKHSIAIWGSLQRLKGLEDAESYRLFYLTYGVDVMTAQTLNAKESESLNNKLINKACTV